VKIDLGTSAGKHVSIDVDVLLRTRLLVQASSGGGKSWLLRRLTEQLFGKVQVLIIDPEGEFATLRERYGYVLVGKGGETPADPRSAKLLAHKLLELHASAVCDLYELQPQARHSWVQAFLEAMIDAPKKLWHPVVVIVDEAHQFAPEKGAGESEASSAMIDLATRGRKRGFCAVFATQRLGKLRKDAAAELTNVLIGQTFIDVDRKRAADALGIEARHQAEFFNEMRLLKPGHFWALGRAIATERVLVQVGPITTTHPDVGTAGKRSTAEPPPAPDQVKALLPKLADLPAEAEAKAKTEADLRAEIRSLKAELKGRPTVEIPVTEPTKAVEIPIVKEPHLKRLEAAIDRSEKVAASYTEANRELRELLRRVTGAAELASMRLTAPASLPAPMKRLTGRPPTAAPASNGAGASGVEQRILNALAELELLGANRPERELVAFMAGYSHLQSKGFVNAVSSLRTAGRIEYPDRGTIVLTEAGQRVADYPNAPRSAEEVQQRVISLLGGASGRILEPLIQAYPSALAREDVARAAGYGHLQSKGFVNAISRLRTLGFVDYPDRGSIVAKPVLFLEGAR
jgi:hypothetical protein